jgi:hypothetical protein
VPRKSKHAEDTHADKVIPFQAAQDEEAVEEREKPPAAAKEPSVLDLKRLAKQAMRALKAGKQVAAFELLKKMTQE